MTDTARITVDKDQVLAELMAAVNATFPDLEQRLAFLYRLAEEAAGARSAVTDLILAGEFRIAHRSGAEPDTRRLAEITGLEPRAVRHRWRAWLRRNVVAAVA